jgi:hypothetical protein
MKLTILMVGVILGGFLIAVLTGSTVGAVIFIFVGAGILFGYTWYAVTKAMKPDDRDRSSSRGPDRDPQEPA